MLWLYWFAAVLIAWGVARDISRQETWLIGFGKTVRKEQPRRYWLTILMRLLLLLAIIVVAYQRSRLR